MPEIIGQEILLQQGSFRRVRRWLRGKHPSLGVLQPPHLGLSGDWETVQEVTVLVPLFRVDMSNEQG